MQFFQKIFQSEQLKKLNLKSKLYKIVKKKEFRVNSAHHQAIKKIGKSIRKITYTIQNEIAVFSNVLGESIKGIRQVKSYNQEKYETSNRCNYYFFNNKWNVQIR